MKLRKRKTKIGTHANCIHDIGIGTPKYLAKVAEENLFIWAQGLRESLSW